MKRISDIDPQVLAKVRKGTVIPAQVLALCRITQIAYSEVGQIQIYSISVEGDSPDKLLAALAPQMAEALQAVQEISVDIKVMDGRLSEITFKSDFLDGILAVKDSVKTDFVIPQAVQYSVKEGVLTSDRELAKDVIRIYRAWGELNNRRFLKTDIRIKADCNTIAFDEELALYRVSEANEDISRIQTGDLAITFTEDGIVGLENVTGGLTSNLPAKFDSNTVMGISGLIGLAYQMCLNGELSCREMGEHYEYSIALNETAMRDIALAILPEIDKMNIKLEAGSMQLTVEDDRLEALSIDCSGRAKVLLLELDIYLGADLNFEANPDEEDMLEELYSLGKNGNILVLKKGLIGTGIYYMGEPEKYQSNSKKKWYWGKLIYLEQK